MSKPYGIIILGANGSGKSTLGRELTRVLNFAHFDAENYYWHKTDMPFTVARSHKERKDILLSDIEKHDSYVMSGDVSNWGEQFLSLFDLVVFLIVPADIRIERIKKREYERFGDRIRKGGDMYEQHLKFVEFAASRDIALIEHWALLYSCPILRVDGTKTLKENIDEILTYINTRNHYDALIDEINDPVRDPVPLKAYMDKWDGEAFIEVLRLSPDKSVLEVGVGTGRLAVRVCGKCGRFTGIDISPKIIERAKENLRDFDNASLVYGNFLTYSFNERFDTIYSSLTFMHIQNKRAAIQRAANLLNPSGRFVLSIDKNQQTEIDYASRYGSRKIAVYPDKAEEITALITEAGLNIEKQFETEFAVIFAAKKG